MSRYLEGKLDITSRLIGWGALRVTFISLDH